MKTSIATVIAGISFGACGCSNEAKVAGRPMPAAEESAESPVVSPGVAVQTSADASVANEMPSDDDLKPGEPLASVSLTASAGPGGSVSLPSDRYEIGETTSLTAKSNSGYDFVKWSGDCAGQGSTCSLTMNANKVATAFFSCADGYYAVGETCRTVLNGWVDITAAGSTNSTMLDISLNLKWTNRRPDAKWLAAENHCSTLTYNGFLGWRLPTKYELLSAKGYSIFSAAKEGWITASDLKGLFWSSSPLDGNPVYAILVNPSFPRIESSHKYSDYAYRVVCVHECNPGYSLFNGKCQLGSTWVDVSTPGSTKLTMKDMRTNLKWSGTQPRATWQGAIDHCLRLNYNGVTGWRLPKKDELQVAYENGISGAAKVGWITEGNFIFWSADPHGIQRLHLITYENAWVVNAELGNTVWNSKYSSSAVVCVQ